MKKLREEGRVDLEIMTNEYKNFRQYVAIEIDVSKRIAGYFSWAHEGSGVIFSSWAHEAPK